MSKGQLLAQKTRHTTYLIVKICPPVFAQLTLLPTPKILCFTMLFNRPDTPKVPLPVGHLHPQSPSNTWFPGPTQLSIPNCITIGSAVYAHGRESLYFTMCVKTRLTRD